MEAFMWLVSTGVRLALTFMGLVVPIILFIGIIKVVSVLEDIRDSLAGHAPSRPTSPTNWDGDAALAKPANIMRY